MIAGFRLTWSHSMKKLVACGVYILLNDNAAIGRIHKPHHSTVASFSRRMCVNGFLTCTEPQIILGKEIAGLSPGWF
jgi:hypothetical protein